MAPLSSTKHEEKINILEHTGNKKDYDEDKDVSEIIDEIGNNHFLLLQLLILAPCLAADGIEVTSFGYIINLLVIEGQLLAENSYYSGLVSSSVFVGMLLGGVICGFLSDRFGRKQILSYCMILTVLAAVLSGCTLFVYEGAQLYWLLFARFLAGFAASGSVPGAFTLALEIAPANLRLQVINILDGGWSLGLIYISTVAVYLLSGDASELKETGSISYHHWPMFTLISGFPAAIATIMIWLYVEESPVYIQKYTKDHSRIPIILNKMWESRLRGDEKNLVSCIPTVSRNFLSSHDRLDNHLLDEKEKSNTLMESFRELFGPELRSTTIRLIVAWFSICFAVFGLASWVTVVFNSLGFDENPYYPSLYFAYASIPGITSAILILPYVGTHNTIVVSLCSSVLFLVLSSVHTSTTMIILGTTGFQVFSSVAFNTIDVLTTDAFPTSVKGIAYGVASGSGRIGGIIAGFLNGYLLKEGKNGGSRVLLVNALILSIGAIAIFGMQRFR